MLDAPANRGKYVGMMSLTYISVEEFTEQVGDLLENEGIPVSVNQHNNKNVVLVPLSHMDAMVVFSSHKQGLERVRYWARLLDKPSLAETKQYYIYHPRFARASDIGDSLAPLIAARSGGSSSSATRSSDGQKSLDNQTTGQVPKATSQVGGRSEDVSFVVDERSNAIVFYSTGKSYQTLVPLIEKLDILPKQVLLDVMIAEVTLTDEFSLGVDFALKSGSVSLPDGYPLGSLITGGIAGGSIAIGGDNAGIIATALQTNQLVNVLSNPSVLVRDGVKADLSVGTQISVVGSTVSDDVGSGDKTKTNVEYRKTGVEISVTPTVNAQGIVIMEISEKISNEVKGASGASGNPNIFERTLNTEVVAESGQTIILAGLVSSDTSETENGIPFLKDLPAVGSLFKTTSTSNTKTELVMLVTPRVIHRTDQWQRLTREFQRGLSNLSL
jgi:general secretion pathway protein D